eukprot:Skav202821  [mRNA]  locus=scaffold3852:99509:104038:- [translate_table: standard]
MTFMTMLTTSLDTLGAEGCLCFTPRRNIMLRLDTVHFNEDRVVLQGPSFAPEGLGFAAFSTDKQVTHSDKILHTQEFIRWDVNAPLPPLGVKLWFHDLLEEDVLDALLVQHFSFDPSSRWMEVPNPDFGEPVKVLEGFAGGFGGWKAAIRLMTRSACTAFRTLAVEKDPTAAKSYAATHKTMYIPEGHDFSILHSLQDDVMVCADLFDEELLGHLCKWEPTVLTLSAPCPPWSGATASPGLSRHDGQLIAKGLGLLRWVRPLLVCLEQVANFARHPDYDTVMRIPLWLGYRLSWARVFDVIPASKTKRPRWLAILVRNSLNIPLVPLQPWPVDVTSSTYPLLQLDDAVLETLQVSQKAKELAQNHRFLKGGSADMTPAQVLQRRIVPPHGNFPTFMARYGSQEDLSERTLEEYGYFAHFVIDEATSDGYRYFHPQEVLILHGVLDQTFLPTSLADGWLIAGNQIAIPHAIFVLTHALRLLGTPMNPGWNMRAFQDERLDARTSQIQITDAGSFVLHQDSQLTANFLQQVNQLFAENAPLAVWHPITGFDVEHQMDDIPENPVVADFLMASQVSNHPPSPTQTFETVLQGKIHFGSHSQVFWFSANLDVDQIQAVWWDQFAVEFHVGANPAAVLTHDDTVSTCTRPVKHVLVLQDTQLTILSLDHENLLLPQLVAKGLDHMKYDQFGLIPSHQKLAINLLLLEHPLEHSPFHLDMIFLTCAITQLGYMWSWDLQSDDVVFTVEGDSTAQNLAIQAVQGIFDRDTLLRIGRSVRTSNDSEVRFVPGDEGAVTPHGPTCECLAIALARQMLTALSNVDLGETPVVIKWFGRILWQGRLSGEHQLQVLLVILRFALAPVTHGNRLRFVNVCPAPQAAHEDTLLKTLPPNERYQAILLSVQPAMSGGGAKQQVRLAQQTAMASMLLQQGYPLQWVSEVVNKILQRLSPKRIETVTNMPAGAPRVIALEQLVQETGSEFPTVTNPAKSKPVNGTPWNKHKQPRLQGHQLDVTGYKLTGGFFQNADGSDAQQISQVKPQATGICLMNHSHASQWIQPGVQISADELAVLVPGHMDVPGSLQSQAVKFPCTMENGTMILLSGLLIQLGKKAVLAQKGQADAIKEDPAQLVAFTLYKEDWSPEDWKQVTTQTVMFIRDRLAEDKLDKAVLSFWGRSLRCNRSPASPQQATTVQIHGSVLATQIHALLKVSGQNSIYCLPKTSEGRPSEEYRIVWLEGDHAQALCASSQTVGCLGLIRGKNQRNFGLRYKVADFSKAWQVLHPSEAEPVKPTGTHAFKLEGLPFGVSATALSAWLTAIKWHAVPLRALGATAWVVKSDDQPPAGLQLFNTTPVLIKLLPPRATQNAPLVIGAPPKPVTGDPWQQGQDPWAGYTPTKPVAGSSVTPPVRAVQGPDEARFAAQDEKIAAMQHNLTQLEHQQTHTTKQLEHLEQGQKLQGQHFQETIGKLQSDVDAALKSTLSQHSKQMDSRFDQLLQIMKKRSKRKQGEGKGDDEDDDMSS